MLPQSHRALGMLGQPGSRHVVGRIIAGVSGRPPSIATVREVRAVKTKEHTICPRCGHHTNPNLVSPRQRVLRNTLWGAALTGLPSLLGRQVGAHIGIAALGGATAGAVPLAVAGGLLGVGVWAASKHIAWCPECRRPFVH